MRKPRIYLETTIFNYFFDVERDGHTDTVLLFKEIQARKFEAYTSVYVVDELKETKDESKRLKMLALISKYNVTILPDDDEAQYLANIYINEGVIPANKRFDSLHISISTINDLDYIFSYNFTHINRDKTKKMTSVINIREGYKPITITTASEVVEHGDHE